MRVKQSTLRSLGGNTLITLFLVLASLAAMAQDSADTASEAALWDILNQSDDPGAIRAYLDLYPDGQFAAAARRKLEGFGPDDSAQHALAQPDAMKAPEHACDRLAADPYDPNRVTDGVFSIAIRPAEAIAACKAAVADYPDEMRFNYQLGRAYVVAERMVDALAAHRVAVEQNYAPALLEYAYLINTECYPLNDGISPITVRLFQAAADTGYVPALEAYGRHLKSGEDDDANKLGRAIAYLEDAADEGYHYAIRHLARHYRDADPPDPAKANRYYDEAVTAFEAAIAAGDDDAALSLTTMYHAGEGVEKDPTKAAALAEQVIARVTGPAIAGNSWATGTLTYIYEYGVGVEKDAFETLFWKRAAAEIGGMWDMYVYAEAVANDDAEAAKWQARMQELELQQAEAGLPGAMIERADRLRAGDGVATDAAAADMWEARAVAKCDDPQAWGLSD